MSTELLKRLFSRRVRRRMVMARLRVRLIGPHPYALPNLLIVGTQRGGTSSLYKYLGGHSWAHASLRKETEYFSSMYGRGERWYRAHFVPQYQVDRELRRGRSPLVFEATPDYLLHPLAAGRAAGLVPDARLIVLLRDPVRRAISHYQHMVRLGFETLGLEEALEAEEERISSDLAKSLESPDHRPTLYLRFSYRERGHYAQQLMRWLDVYPRDRVLILESERLYENPATAFNDILSFLDLPPWMPPGFRNFSYGVEEERPEPLEPSSQTLAQLRAHYEPHDLRLVELLGWTPSWMEAATRPSDPGRSQC